MRMKNRLVEAGEIRAMAAPSPDERKATEIIFDDRPAPAEFSRRRPIDAVERCSIGTSARRHARLETDRTGRFFSCRVAMTERVSNRYRSELKEDDRCRGSSQSEIIAVAARTSSRQLECQLRK